MATISQIQAISKKKNGKKLTTKQALFVSEYLKEPNASKAGRAVYDSKQMGVENLSKPMIENVLAVLMDSKGITDDYLLEKIGQGIETAEVEGKQINFIELALKLKGHMKQVNVNLSHTIKESRSQYGL